METNQIKGLDFLNKPRRNHKNGQINIPSNIYTLKKNIRKTINNQKKKERTTASRMTGVLIESWESETIDRLVASEDHNRQLKKLLAQNIEDNNIEPGTYEFYTDGSLSHRGTENVRMGAA